jgi:hypothetical protein
LKQSHASLSEFTSTVFPILMGLQGETQPEGSGSDEVLGLVYYSESAPNLKLTYVLQAGDKLSDDAHVKRMKVGDTLVRSSPESRPSIIHYCI